METLKIKQHATAIMHMQLSIIVKTVCLGVTTNFLHEKL
jgi:hypothetical protein